jgi:imidazolonepropionase-like amidohydrolase
MLRGNRAGLDITPERAIRWITSNAAKSLGIDDQTGSLAAGKMADVVLWNQDPFSVYAKPLQVYIDGVLRFELGNPALNPQSDFELGQLLGASQ